MSDIFLEVATRADGIVLPKVVADLAGSGGGSIPWPRCKGLLASEAQQDGMRGRAGLLWILGPSESKFRKGGESGMGDLVLMAQAGTAEKYRCSKKVELARIRERLSFYRSAILAVFLGKQEQISSFYACIRRISNIFFGFIRLSNTCVMPVLH